MDPCYLDAAVNCQPAKSWLGGCVTRVCAFLATGYVTAMLQKSAVGRQREKSYGVFALHV